MSHYRITPLQKKSIRNIYELYRQTEDGETEWVNIIELYRSGVGFLSNDEDTSLPFKDDDIVYCWPNLGENESCDFDDSTSVSFEFCDSLSEEECNAIEDAYYEGGAGWVYEGEHDWQVEQDSIEIDAPFKVELVDEDGLNPTEVNLD